jgi:outer membrane receptor protein involved in Fe transport
MKHFFSFLFIIVGFSVSAQTTLKGFVKDAKTSEPLIGAVIFLNGTSYNAVAGLDGSYVIKNIPAGSYKLTSQYIGYTTLEQTLTVSGEPLVTLNLNLQEKKNELSEIVITGTLNTESDANVRKLEQTSNQVINIVSARTIEISPDLTVANIIQRVSGVSIERNSNGDGQYAILRGMDKRYNYTLVNGIKIPSPDNKYRYVPLDLFPSDLIGRLEVSKSLTPDMEGDAVGGVVNIIMKDAPAEKMLKANLAGGYNQLFLNRDFVSFDAGSVNKKSPYELNGNTYNATINDFPKGTITYKSHAPIPNIIGGIALGNRILDNKLGVIVAGSFQDTYRGSNSDFFQSTVYDTERTSRVTSLAQRQYSEEQKRLGLHAKVDYRLSEKSKLQWYNAFMNLTNEQLRDTKTTDFSSGGYDPEKGNAGLTFSTRSRLTLQQIFNSTLQGFHTILEKLRFNWSAVYSIASNQIPDNATINLLGKRENFIETKLYPQQSSRRWEHNNDRDIAGYVNFTYPVTFLDNTLEISTGGLYRDKQRVNFYNNYTLQPVNSFAVYGQDFNNYNEIAYSVANPRGSVASALTYDASEKIGAGYLMGKFNSATLQIIGGVRAEHTNQGYQMKFPLGELNPSGSQNYTDFLPSLNVKYSPQTNTNLRASYYWAVNRPGFFEIVPGKVVNEEYQERGNANLKHAVADNFDLRYELFPTATDQFMAGVFYKYIQNPIEYTLQLDETRGQDVFYTPGNFGNATNYGLELDFIKYFRNFGIKANYTYTKSSITTKKNIRIRDDGGNLKTISVDQTRPLYGQADHVANLSFLYKDTKNGWDGQLAGSYTGERINTVSQFLDNDLWQSPFIQVDASLEKKLNEHWVVFAKANNLLNTPMKVFIKGTNPENGNIPEQNTGNSKTLIRQDYYQQSYLLGVRFKL